MTIEKIARDEMREDIERIIAGTVFRNNPDMSGDQRRKLRPEQLRAVQSAASEILPLITQVEKSTRASDDDMDKARRIIARWGGEFQVASAPNLARHIAEAIAQERAASYRAGAEDMRERAAKAAGDHSREDRDYVPGSLWDKLTREAQARIRALPLKEEG